MYTSRREKKYAQENFKEVLHTTLNPEGPGVIRIHMIPPRYEPGSAGITGLLGCSVVIINGQDVIPVGPSWSILLAEFIKNVNEYHDREITQEDSDNIIEKTCKGAGKVFPFVSKKRMARDIRFIMETFRQIAYREPVDAEIGYMNLGDYAPYMCAPHRMDLMVSAMTKDGSWHCNQNCVHCYAAGQHQAEEAELGTEDWKRIIDACRKARIPQITFTGGEPTMRDDLVELIDYSRWFVTRLNTNGIKLTEEMCRKLAKASLDSVQITFYSSDEKIHNELVGSPHYAETVAGIENALKAGLSLSVNTPLCALNRDYKATLEFLHQKGVKYVTCSGLIITGKATGEKSSIMRLTRDEIKTVLKEAVEYCFANGMEMSFTSPGWVENSFCDELGITTPVCGACLSNMAVTPGGNVVPCQSWLSGPVLGNMLKDEWEKIWDSEECAKHRDYSAMMTGICPLGTGVQDEN